MILPASAFDSRAKFLFCLREQFSSGMFSLNGSVNNRDVADLYSFLKKDYQLGRPQRCQLIKHLGYQGNNYWYISEKVNNSAKKCLCTFWLFQLRQLPVWTILCIMNDFPVIVGLLFNTYAHLPRTQTSLFRVRAKEGGDETTGVIGDLLMCTGLWDRQGGKHCELRVHTRVVRVGLWTDVFAVIFMRSTMLTTPIYFYLLPA